MLRFLLVLVVLLAAGPFPAQVPAGRGDPRVAPTAVRLRIGVTSDGMVRITPAHLASAGVDPASVDPRSFALSSQGQAVAIHIEGEDDGRFDAADYVQFFGQRFRGAAMEEKYTDENVYWLEIGGDAGPRVPAIDATPQGALTPPFDFAATLRAEESHHWYTHHTMQPPTEDTWFWERLQPVGAGQGVTRTLAAFVPYPVANAPFQLEMALIARSQGHHHTTLSLGNELLASLQWSGKGQALMTATVPAGRIGHGNAAVRAGAINRPGVVADDVYVNYWQLSFRRLFIAWQGQLDFHAEQAQAAEYLTSGWASDRVAVWDVSQPHAPKRLVGAAAAPAGQSYTLRFRAAPQIGDRLWLQEEQTMFGAHGNAPLHSISLASPPHLSAGAEVVIVTSAELQPAASRLAQHHAAQGLVSQVVLFQQAVDAFNEGIYHPRAVPQMLAWMVEHGPQPTPRYLVLLGDGHWNFMGFNPGRYPPEPNHVPPYLAWADPWQGEVPADNRFADLNGDLRPDLAVGRIAASTLAEAQAVVDKILAYDTGWRAQPWQRRALFVADNADSGGDFAAVSDQIIAGHLPADLQAQRVYLGVNTVDAAAARAAISAAIAEGVWMIQYAGHGEPRGWAHEDIWSRTDIAALGNSASLPIVMTFNCLDGYFAYPGNPGLAETMQRHAGGGSIAAISPTGLGTTPVQQEFRKLLMDVLFEEQVARLGDALLVTKQRFYDRHGPGYMVETMTLFGDPTMRLPQALHWLYLPITHGAP